MTNEKIMVLDVETTNSLDDPLMYDIGFVVTNKKGEIFEKGSYIVAETFFDEELMESAYFAEKIPQYWKDIKSKKRIVKKLISIRFIIIDMVKKYGIKKIAAYNARFDYKAGNTTQRFLTNSQYRFFFPYGMEFMDILKLARNELQNNEEYIRFCEENGYMTNHKIPKPRLTAEIVYRFLFDAEFEESHTGLEDALIEAKIMAYFLKQNPNVNWKLWDKVS